MCCLRLAAHMQSHHAIFTLWLVACYRPAYVVPTNLPLPSAMEKRLAG